MRHGQTATALRDETTSVGPWRRRSGNHERAPRRPARLVPRLLCALLVARGLLFGVLNGTAPRAMLTEGQGLLTVAALFQGVNLFGPGYRRYALLTAPSTLLGEEAWLTELAWLPGPGRVRKLATVGIETMPEVQTHCCRGESGKPSRRLRASSRERNAFANTP